MPIESHLHDAYAANPRQLDIAQRMRELEDERAIRNIAHAYCDAADRRDWARWLGLFHAGATYEFVGVYSGPVAEFVTGVQARFSHIASTHHQIGNIEVRVRGARAVCQCYFTAHHRMPAAAPVDVFPRHRAGVDEDWWVGGRYLDELAYRDGRWGIVHRAMLHDWHRWETAEPRGFVRDATVAPPGVDERWRALD